MTAPSFTVPLVEHARTPFPPDIDITPTSGRYVGFFENRHGEQLVYVHERGSDPVLYHGDYEWQPVTVTTPVIARVGTIATWQVGGADCRRGRGALARWMPVRQRRQ